MNTTVARTAATPATPTIDLLDLAELKPYERNPRTHAPEQVEQIAQALDSYGMVGAIVVRRGVIAKGHGTLAAIRHLFGQGKRLYPAPGKSEPGCQPYPEGKVPVLHVFGWTDAQFRAYAVADNKLALNAGWDEDLLRTELRELEDQGTDLESLGFTLEERADLFAEKVGHAHPDHAPDLPTTATSKTGHTWVLGAHRVRCGDSTQALHVAALMAGQKAHAMWTDPPYNVDYEAADGRKVENDSMASAQFRRFLRLALRCAYEVLRPGAPVYVAHADTEGLNFRAAFADAGLQTAGCLIWAKDALVLGRSDYQWQHEPILYGWKPGAAHTWYGGRRQTTVMELEADGITTNPDGSMAVTVGGDTWVITGKHLQASPVESTVLRVARPKKSAQHPTMKPVELISRMLRNSTREGDLVLDLFGGSGSTLIACEMLGRQARLLELEPGYVDVTVQRWQEFTGKTATLDIDGRTFDEVTAARGQPAEPAPAG